VKKLQSCPQTRQHLSHHLPHHLPHHDPPPPNMDAPADPRLRARQQAAAAAPPPPPPPPAEPASMGMDGASDAHAEQNMVPDDSFKLKFCTVCASNQNRYVIR